MSRCEPSRRWNRRDSESGFDRNLGFGDQDTCPDSIGSPPQCRSVLAMKAPMPLFFLAPRCRSVFSGEGCMGEKRRVRKLFSNEERKNVILSSIFSILFEGRDFFPSKPSSTRLPTLQFHNVHSRPRFRPHSSLCRQGMFFSKKINISVVLCFFFCCSFSSFFLLSSSSSFFFLGLARCP